MKPKIGTTLRSAVDAATFVVLRWESGELQLTCGGLPISVPVESALAAGELQQDHATGTLVGKRYCTDDGSIELLCTKAGRGALAVGGIILAPKSANPLPSSD